MLEQVEIAIRFAGEAEIPEPPYDGPIFDAEPANGWFYGPAE